MAIQLSERDNLIFRYIDEHQVLLEKHIAWFISCDDKPVLIRDRLRKLFYLDYLLCERHGGKLPWWTTPTKPLVYMLSPMSRQLAKAAEAKSDLTSADVQRHLLEVANLRMLFLMDQKETIISGMQWTTTRREDVSIAGLDAMVSFTRDGSIQRVGVMNQPGINSSDLCSVVQKAIVDNKLDSIWIVSRDEAHMAQLQKILSTSQVAGKLGLTTHQEVYKSGICKAKWQSAVAQSSGSEIMLPWGSNLSPAQAF